MQVKILMSINMTIFHRDDDPLLTIIEGVIQYKPISATHTTVSTENRYFTLLNIHKNCSLLLSNLYKSEAMLFIGL